MVVLSDHSIRVKRLDSNKIDFLNLRAYDVEWVDISYFNGVNYRNVLTDKNNYKAWGTVTRLMKKKAYQDSEVGRVGENTIEPGWKNKGLGGRFKWDVRATEVYHKSTEAVVEKHYHAWNAVLVFPGSWVDTQLQKAYNTRKPNHTKENNEQKDTPKRFNWK